VPLSWDHLRQLLQVEVEFWPPAGVGCASFADTGAGEREAEEAAGESDAGQRYTQGNQRNRVLTPDQRREAVAHREEAFKVSQHRACGVLGVDRKTAR